MDKRSVVLGYYFTSDRQLIYVDEKLSVLTPFRRYGGAAGEVCRYIFAVDVLSKKLSENDLKDKIVLIGSTAPGLQDLRTTPVEEAYPGVETHVIMYWRDTIAILLRMTQAKFRQQFNIQ